VIPEVDEIDGFWEMKQKGIKPSRHYTEIHMPKNTPYGVYIGALSFSLSFGLIWYMMWLAALSFIGIIVCLSLRLSDTQLEYHISASEVEKIERQKDFV
jgi:cytochrome o ubiquinol oxidase subunit 1